MLIFHQIIFHKKDLKLQLMDFNPTKEYMDSILMVIMALLTPEDSLILKKNNLHLYTLQFKRKLIHTMQSLEDITLMFHQKYLKTFVGFVKDGMNNNLNLPYLKNSNKTKNLCTCTLILSFLLLDSSIFRTKMSNM